jgi:hypothetical protein
MQNEVGNGDNILEDINDLMAFVVVFDTESSKLLFYKIGAQLRFVCSRF